MLGTHNHGDAAMPYYVYILASRRYGTLYIGVTNDLRTRLEQHRLGLGSAFVRKYGVHRLVYVEAYEWAEERHPPGETIEEMESGLENSAH
jgi:hypothetical protein